MRHPVLLLTTLLLGCATDEENAAIECPTDSFVTYENFGQPFMTTWCTPCHSSQLDQADARQDAPLGVDFDSYEAVLSHAEAIQLFVVDTDAMPPAGGPSDDDLGLLAEWLACGLPEGD